jgi:hypothetical protein
MVGLVGTETMPGVFAPVGMEYGHKYGGTSFELFARIAEKNNAHWTLNPRPYPGEDRGLPGLSHCIPG